MTTTTKRQPDLSSFPARLALVEHIHGWNHVVEGYVSTSSSHSKLVAKVSGIDEA